MVAEMRAARTELDNMRHFTPERQPIRLSRDLITEWSTPARPIDVEKAATKSASGFSTAAKSDLIEVG